MLKKTVRVIFKKQMQKIYKVSKTVKKQATMT